MNLLLLIIFRLNISMIKVFAILLALALVATDDILEVIECEASFGDHVIPSPEFCDRCSACSPEY